MNVSSRTARRALFVRERQQLDTICFSCLFRPTQRRSVSAVAAAEAPQPQPTPQPQPPKSRKPSPPPAPKRTYRVLASVVLSRPPLLTPTAHPFERAYHLYNRRLNERLALPFTRYFYYKKGTPQDGEWKRKVRARNTAARDIGTYNAYAHEGWNDEVLVGDSTGTWDNTIGEVYRDAEGFTEDAIRGKGTVGLIGSGEVGASPPETTQESGQGADTSASQQGAEQLDAASSSESSQTPSAEDPVPAAVGDVLASTDMEVTGAVVKEGIPRPAPRESQADKDGDMKSLSRRMDRTLYLLVRNGGGEWVFPGDLIRGKEGLHQAAERVLVQAGGINMNTWVVGNAPIGWRRDELVEPVVVKDQNVQELGNKTFFMKARIMTGQMDLSKNALGDTDFQWLAKDEIQKVVHSSYYSSIKNMLVER